MAITVTATQGGSTGNGMALRVMVLTQAAATQNGASNSVSGNGSGQLAVTTTQTGSRVYGAALRASATAPTVNGVTTQIDGVSDATHGLWYGTWKASSLTGTPGATTFGYTATFNGGIAGLEILTAGTLTEDASAPAGVSTTTATTLSTAGFTPPAGSLLVALVSSDGGGSVTTMTVSDGTLTWTEAVKGNAAGEGYTGVWIAQVPPAGTSLGHPVQARALPLRGGSTASRAGRYAGTGPPVIAPHGPVRAQPGPSRGGSMASRRGTGIPVARILVTAGSPFILWDTGDPVAPS